MIHKAAAGRAIRGIVYAHWKAQGMCLLLSTVSWPEDQKIGVKQNIGFCFAGVSRPKTHTIIMLQPGWHVAHFQMHYTGKNQTLVLRAQFDREGVNLFTSKSGKDHQWSLGDLASYGGVHRPGVTLLWMLEDGAGKRCLG